MNVQSLPEMARCLRTRKVIQAYLDGETDPDTTRRVAAHLARCGRCGLQAATYRAIKHALAGPGGRLDELPLHRLRAFTAAIADTAAQADPDDRPRP